MIGHTYFFILLMYGHTYGGSAHFDERLPVVIEEFSKMVGE